MKGLTNTKADWIGPMNVKGQKGLTNVKVGKKDPLNVKVDKKDLTNVKIGWRNLTNAKVDQKGLVNVQRVEVDHHRKEGRTIAQARKNHRVHQVIKSFRL